MNKLISRVTDIFFSNKKWVALITLIPVGVWTYSRVGNVNPAILGDEYLYSMNARKASPWDPSPVGDFSNYLFNFVYQATNLCGPSFYSCAKILNIFFFLGFIFILFIIGTRFIGFWPSLAFMVVAGLSPLSVYTSMFLPESMYMFFIGLLLLAVLQGMQDFSNRSWLVVGAVIGITSLVKPHAWLSAIAVAITLAAVGLGNREIGLRRTVFAFGYLAAGAALARIFIGLVIAGPKALGFFGQYLGVGILQEVVEGPVQNSSGLEVVGTSPMAGVFALFGNQIYVHALVVSALMAISIAAILVGVFDIFKSRKLTAATGFALFSVIWLFSMVVEIVIFTGWITGAGDDHTTRVLLRYYEFLFLIVPLAGIAVLANKYAEKTNIVFRWVLAGALGLLISPAFTGFFANLTIQIADAPTLAGLVVNADVFNAVAVIGFVAILIFATFPRYAVWTYILLLPATMVGTGWQIQDQYIGFRGQLEHFDRAGLYLAENFNEEQLSQTLLLANTRFNATGAFFWADSVATQYELYVPGSTIDDSIISDDVMYVVTMDDIVFSGAGEIVFSNDEFTVHSRRN